MSAPVASPCLWVGCPNAGPYADDKALFEHLLSAHNVQTGSFHCQWLGCTRKSQMHGPNGGSRHLGTHTKYRPVACAHAGCSFASKSQYVLQGHRESKHGSEEPGPEHEGTDSGGGLVCRWARCGSTFSSDNAGAEDLWVHLTDEHLLASGPIPVYQCQWGNCMRAFQRSFGQHLRSHLPKWYRPYECTSCHRTFPTSCTLTKHLKLDHPCGITEEPNNDDPQTDGPDKSSKKRPPSGEQPCVGAKPIKRAKMQGKAKPRGTKSAQLLSRIAWLEAELNALENVSSKSGSARWERFSSRPHTTRIVVGKTEDGDDWAFS